MKQRLIVIVLLVLFVGCKIHRPIVEVPINKEEKITDELLPIEIEGENALISALFWCDSLNQVQMTLINELRSKNMNVSLYFQNGLFTFNAWTNSSTHWLPFRTIERTNDKVVKVEVPVVTNKLKWYQKLFMYIGIIATVVLITWGFIKIRMPFKRH